MKMLRVLLMMCLVRLIQGSLSMRKKTFVFKTTAMPSNEKGDAPKVWNDFFDFSLFVDGLSALVPKKAITDQVRECVITLAYVYDVDVLSMQNIVLGAVTELQTIDIERLRKGARDWYQFENGQALPVLVKEYSLTLHV